LAASARHIKSDGLDIEARLDQPPRRRFALHRIARPQKNPHSGFRQLAADLEPDPAVCARHKGD